MNQCNVTPNSFIWPQCSSNLYHRATAQDFQRNSIFPKTDSKVLMRSNSHDDVIDYVSFCNHWPECLHSDFHFPRYLWSRNLVLTLTWTVSFIRAIHWTLLKFISQQLPLPFRRGIASWTVLACPRPTWAPFFDISYNIEKWAQRPATAFTGCNDAMTMQGNKKKKTSENSPKIGTWETVIVSSECCGAV